MNRHFTPAEENQENDHDVQIVASIMPRPNRDHDKLSSSDEEKE